jgi:uncharacterized protein YuzE
MALKDLNKYLDLAPAARYSPKDSLWSSYDEEGDVLYIHFDKSSRVTDSEMTDDDIILRYDGERVVGITVLHASER